jgi:hypothetical protein
MKKETHNKGRKIGIIVLLCILLLAIIFFVILLTSFLTYRNSIMEVKEMKTTLNVSDYVGINLDTDKLHFGTVFPGGYSVREVTINSSQEGFVYVAVQETAVQGGFSDWIFVSSQGKFVDAESPATLMFTAKSPNDAKPGNYGSTLKFYVLKKKPSCLTRALFFRDNLVKVPTGKIEAGSATISILIGNTSFAENRS